MIDAGGRPSVNWQFLAYVILTLGETMVSITGLEFSYTQAPNKMKSAVMALWLFTVRWATSSPRRSISSFATPTAR